MAAYYNEIDEYCGQWLKNLIAKGLIPDGEVDGRSIRDVAANDIGEFQQCHWFAGIGGFGLACRLAGVPDDAEIWTGGFPCQPFSVAGRQLAQEDDRHLWPVLSRLIEQKRPAVFIGENVAGIIDLALDGVLFDLEAAGYASRAFVVPACAVNAPHRRDRVWIAARHMADASGGQQRRAREPGAGAGWRELPVGGYGGDGGDVADASGERRDGREDAAGRNLADGRAAGWQEGSSGLELLREDASGDVEHAAGVGRGEGRAEHELWSGRATAAGPGVSHGDVGNANGAGSQERDGVSGDARQERAATVGAGWRSPWDGSEYLPGADGKARRVKSGVRLLAHGVPARVAKLRAGGNAIAPQVAAEIIKAVMEVRP